MELFVFYRLDFPMVTVDTSGRSHRELMQLAVNDIVSNLIEAYRSSKDVNLNRLKCSVIMTG